LKGATEQVNSQLRFHPHRIKSISVETSLSKGRRINRTGSTGLFKMIHPISNDYIFEVYKYRVISDTSTKRTTVEVLSLTLQVLYVTSPSYTSNVETIFEFLPYSLQHVALSSCALAFTQTSCFLELPTPPTDALSTWWFSTETSTKLTLHGNNRFTLENLSTKKAFCCAVAIFSQTVCRGATVTVEPSRGDPLKL
jgi:hypothetical protein